MNSKGLCTGSWQRVPERSGGSDDRPCTQEDCPGSSPGFERAFEVSGSARGRTVHYHRRSRPPHGPDGDHSTLFRVAIVSSQLGEPGDGWPLAGVIHLVFPKSYVGVLVPGADLLTLQTAINNGVQEVYEGDRAPEAVVSRVLGSLKAGESKAKARVGVQ